MALSLTPLFLTHRTPNPLANPIRSLFRIYPGSDHFSPLLPSSHLDYYASFSLFNRYLISAYYVPGIILGAQTILVKRKKETDKNPCPHEAYILLGKDKPQTMNIINNNMVHQKFHPTRPLSFSLTSQRPDSLSSTYP